MGKMHNEIVTLHWNKYLKAVYTKLRWS